MQSHNCLGLERTHQTGEVYWSKQNIVITALIMPPSSKQKKSARHDGSSSRQDVSPVDLIQCYWGHHLVLISHSQFDTDIAPGNHKGMKWSLKFHGKRTCFHHFIQNHSHHSSCFCCSVIICPTVWITGCLLAFTAAVFPWGMLPLPRALSTVLPFETGAGKVSVCLLTLTHTCIWQNYLFTASHDWAKTKKLL